MRLAAAALPLIALFSACAKAPQASPQPSSDQFVVEIDIDDHGLNALWNANAPNLKRLIREGTLAYTKVDVPTHSNQNNMTLVTGNYPDGHNVPTNSWLDRARGFDQPFDLAGLGTGNYIYFAQNPLNPQVPHHVSSVWTAVETALLGPTVYVGELPPWEVGSSISHFSISGADLFGLTVDTQFLNNILEGTLGYPAAYVQSVVVGDGPPNSGESLAHFTLRDAAAVWQEASAHGGLPPHYMFVWDFLALDSDPTSKYGADTAAIIKVVEDYDDALGALLKAIDASPWNHQVNILFTLDHGKVNTTQQVCLGTLREDGQQLANLISNYGSQYQVSPLDYELLNEDGDALIYATSPGAGTAIGVGHQEQIAHGLVDLIQQGTLVGVDVSRTITWDGYHGTRRMHDYRIESPYSADVIVFPQPGWTLNSVDGSNTPGVWDPNIHPFPYGRHGGFSTEELYVPLIMWGPAFKRGVLIPHPVNHVDVAPTAMRVLGVALHDAEGAPIEAAFAGSPGEAIADPGDLSTSKDVVLGLAGFEGAPALNAAPAAQAVIVDLAGLTWDATLGPLGASTGWPALAQQGTSFGHAWNRYRAWAENEYELLAGGYPPLLDSAGNWVAEAESDPAQQAPPGRGLILEPEPPLGTVPNPLALQAWNGSAVWGEQSILDVALSNGWAVAVIGQPDHHLIHLPVDGRVQQLSATAATVQATVSKFLGANPHALAVVALGDAPAAEADATSDASLISAMVGANPGVLFAVTSRGGNDISDPSGDQAGPQSSRHVPLILIGPNVAAGRLTDQPAEAADIPATILFGMGLTPRTDLAEGTWVGAHVNPYGVPQPTPSGATGGHALLRAFQLAP